MKFPLLSISVPFYAAVIAFMIAILSSSPWNCNGNNAKQSRISCTNAVLAQTTSSPTPTTTAPAVAALLVVDLVITINTGSTSTTVVSRVAQTPSIANVWASAVKEDVRLLTGRANSSISVTTKGTKTQGSVGSVVSQVVFTGLTPKTVRGEVLTRIREVKDQAGDAACSASRWPNACKVAEDVRSTNNIQGDAARVWLAELELQSSEGDSSVPQKSDGACFIEGDCVISAIVITLLVLVGLLFMRCLCKRCSATCCATPASANGEEQQQDNGECCSCCCASGASGTANNQSGAKTTAEAGGDKKRSAVVDPSSTSAKNKYDDDVELAATVAAVSATVNSTKPVAAAASGGGQEQKRSVSFPGAEAGASPKSIRTSDDGRNVDTDMLSYSPVAAADTSSPTVVVAAAAAVARTSKNPPVRRSSVTIAIDPTDFGAVNNDRRSNGLVDGALPGPDDRACSNYSSSSFAPSATPAPSAPARVYSKAAPMNPFALSATSAQRTPHSTTAADSRKQSHGKAEQCQDSFSDLL